MIEAPPIIKLETSANTFFHIDLSFSTGVTYQQGLITLGVLKEFNSQCRYFSKVSPWFEPLFRIRRIAKQCD